MGKYGYTESNTVLTLKAKERNDYPEYFSQCMKFILMYESTHI